MSKSACFYHLFCDFSLVKDSLYDILTLEWSKLGKMSNHVYFDCLKCVFSDLGWIYELWCWFFTVVHFDLEAATLPKHDATAPKP